MTAKIKRAVRLRIREAEMLERIRPPFLIGAARGILEFFRDYEEKSVNMIFYDKNGR